MSSRAEAFLSRVNARAKDGAAPGFVAAPTGGRVVDFPVGLKPVGPLFAAIVAQAKP